MMRIICTFALVALVAAVTGCSSTRERGFAGGAGIESEADSAAIVGSGGPSSSGEPQGAAEQAGEFSASQDYDKMLSNPGWF